MASTIRSRRVAWRLQRPVILLAVAAAAAGCSAAKRDSSPTTPSRPVPTTAAVTPTTAAGPQTGGPRTVLSPVGLRVRGAPSASAAVLGTAAQGVVLTVVGYTGAAGGWFKVKGATVTGWMSAQPGLSAPGKFLSFSSSSFAVLYPETWTQSVLPAPAPAPTTSVAKQAAPTTTAPAAPSSVAFRPASGPGDILVTAAAGVSQLPQGRPGYGRRSVSQVVVCGATAAMVVYQRDGSAPASTPPASSLPQSLTYLGEIRFAVDKQHALGLYADVTDLGQALQVFKDFVASVTFPSAQCSGG